MFANHYDMPLGGIIFHLYITTEKRQNRYHFYNAIYKLLIYVQ